MKNLIAGLVLGAVATGAVGYGAYLPKVKEASYNEGMVAGKAAGVAQGIEEGIEKAKADMTQSQAAAENAKMESLQKELASKEEALRKATYKPKEAKPEIENWHVEGNTIGDPIPKDAVQNAE